MPSRSGLVVVALLAASVWAIGIPLLSAGDRFNPDFAAAVTYSAMLASFAAVAWLIVERARKHRSIVATAWFVALAAITGAIGNFVEDGLRMTNVGSTVYGLGFFGLLFGLVALTLALALQRQVVLALLVILSLIGMFLAMSGGTPLLPVAWFGIALWILFRGPGFLSAPKLRSSSP